MTCKKLIEVAMPVKEISTESVRDKSIRHGHISTLHLWWARRPLPVCRAVVFASLVPDPLDENCPVQFKEAVQKLLSGSVYKPYDNIPYTSADEPMEDNLRNRLLMFIGKFSKKFIQVEKSGEGKCGLKDMLDDNSLIKSENTDNKRILGIARRLIFVAHNANRKQQDSCDEILAEFDKLYSAIQGAEKNLYETLDRHIQTETVKEKETNLHTAIEDFLDRMPKVYDPFAGGGAIPLEAARLGCRTYANDLNPVAHVIEKASLEFPQKFGKPITYTINKFIEIYGIDEFDKQNDLKNVFGDKVAIKNRLSFDVEFYAKKVLKMTEEEVGHLYPADERGNKPIVYYWTRVGTCCNPGCQAKVPLLRQFYLSKRRGASEREWVYLSPIIKDKQIDFEIKNGKNDFEPWIERANLKCPVCGNVTETKILKKQFAEKKTTEIIIVVIEDSSTGKVFRKPKDHELKVFENLGVIERPPEMMPQNDSQNLKIPFWGFKSFGEMFSDRQILVMLSLVSNLRKLMEELHTSNGYSVALATYMAILIDRIAMRYTSFNTWHIQQDTVEKIMGKQAIPMVFDYPEMNPFTSYTSSAYSQLGQIVDYINVESACFNVSLCQNAASGDRNQFKEKYFDVVVTDPPYYDAIAYADLSDFFYVWLKRTIGKEYTVNFATPNTPKSDECTAIKHNHGGDRYLAKKHFEEKLLQIFKAIEHQTSDIVSIMFAHQSTDAWVTLCNSILNSNMNITGSWAFDTENTGGLKQDQAYLASSVTVSCLPAQSEGTGDSKNVKAAIELKVKKEVEELYKLGFRGADLLTACFGPAVSEFGKYDRVEKASGEEVTVEELLTWARDAAFNAIISDIPTDDFTRFYIGWLNLFGFSETDHDDVRRITQIGLHLDVNDLLTHNILIRNGNKQTLASFSHRTAENKKLGEGNNSFTIDKVHKAMQLLKNNNRKNILAYINENAQNTEDIFWRVANSLKEILPKGIDDQKLISELLANKDNLIKESKTVTKILGEQEDMFNQ